MKLQLALDRLTLYESITVLNETQNYIDVIEVGTGVIKEYGMAIVREIRKAFPKHIIMSDMKICDAGGHEAKQAFEAGSDIVTVMAFSSPRTIKDTMDVAKEYNGRVMVDLLEVKDQEPLQKLVDLDVDLVCLHVGKDKQKKGTFNSELFSLVDGFPFDVAVAGGINEGTVEQVVEGKPEIVIIGSAITKAENPAVIAKNVHEQLKG